MLFSNGSPRVGFQMVLSITQTNPLTHIDPFLLCQLVVTDLSVCMPALGDRIKGGFDEIDETLCAYIML